MIRRFSTRCLFALASLVLASPLRADVIIDWNNQLLSAIRTSSTPPPRASRAMAMTHVAMYDAVNSIDRTHAPYHFQMNVASDTSREAAAAQAGHDVLVQLFPSQASTFQMALENSLAAIPDSPGKSAGIVLGSAAAADILALRANDHSSDVVPYSSANLPGKWEPTPAGFAAALLPNWPTVTPWAMTHGGQFRTSVSPPALDSPEYLADLVEVRDYGSATSSMRTADQTDIARFWADGAGTATPPGHWNLIAQDIATQEGTSLSDNARMFALLNIATADAAVVSWDHKYFYDCWRPITAIREADTDGLAETVADPNWTPLLVTPPFPSYTSGHSTFSGASAAILASFFGTDEIAFTTGAEGVVLPDRSFASFSEAAAEAGMSRIYGGIHFQFDNVLGLSSGKALGEYIAATRLVAVPEPTTGMMGWGMAMSGLVGLHALRRRR